MRLVRRYRNRRLYDTATKAYMTLPELLRAVEAEEVKVVEEQTGRDVTAFVLAQGIAHRAKQNPTEELAKLLHQLIKSLVQPPGAMQARIMKRTLVEVGGSVRTGK